MTAVGPQVLGARWFDRPMRIFFTGGSGKAGKHVVAHLVEQGHQVTNADLTRSRHPEVADPGSTSPTPARPGRRWPVWRGSRS